ncbi:MAG: IS256 family transposase [Thermoanaerobaculia bacterium]
MAKVTRPRVVAKHHLADVDMPAQVTLALAELARAAKEHLLSLSVASGLLVLRELLEAELTHLVGPKGKHRPERTAYRHGREARFVTLGGRLVEVERPRARGRDGKELLLPTYEAVADRDPLTEAALGRMLAGLSTRHYRDALEPVGDQLRTRGTGRSAVSRRFVQATAAKLAQLRARDLAPLRLLALFTDGIEIGGYTIVVALGVDEKGHKHTLGLWEGTTENAAVCKALLGNLIERGLPTDRALLFVIDGGKAIRRAIADAYGDLAAVARCRWHKRENVTDHLPEGLRPVIGRKLDEAWHKDDPDEAERSLRRLADSLEEAHPGAAASIREGLEETLTIARLGLSPALIKTFKSTNPIESLNDGIRAVEHNVKNWKSGKMALRWTAAAVLEREKRFRRINGYRDMWLLERALDRHTKEVTSSRTAA